MIYVISIINIKCTKKIVVKNVILTLLSSLLISDIKEFNLFFLP